MALNINKTASQAKWNIKNEEQLVELWQQHKCRLIQDIGLPQQGKQGKKRLVQKLFCVCLEDYNVKKLFETVLLSGVFHVFKIW